jgi:uncharacterized protein involved in exopolysaccharide biosynthesis
MPLAHQLLLAVMVAGFLSFAVVLFAVSLWSMSKPRR